MKIFNLKTNRIISFIIALSLIFSMGVCAKAEGGDLLATLSVGDIPIELTGGQTVYNNVKIPVLYKTGVENFEVPKLKATAENASHTVVVSETEIDKANSSATATVTVKDGDTELETYTVNMDLIGINMYENGGFEAGENTSFGPSGNPLTRVEGIGYTGEYGLSFTMDYNPVNYGFFPLPTLEAGKEYLSSSMIRISEDTVGIPSNLRFNCNTATADATLNATFYKSGTWVDDYYATGLGNPTAGGRNNTSDVLTNTINLGEGWQNVTTLIIPSKDAVVNSKIFNYGQGAENQGTVNTDDYFMGELVMADVEVSFNGEKVSKYISVGDGINNAQFSSQIFNQLGNTIGMKSIIENRVKYDRTTISYELVSAPSGVTLTNDGKITVSKGTAGAVTIKVTATPTEKWSNPAQNSFSKNLSFILVENTDNINALASLSVGDQNIDINRSVSEYNVDYPVYYENGVEEFALPKVSATAEEGNTVHISAPEINNDNGKAIYTITVSDDESEKTHKININLIGANMYENGGFEAGANQHIGYEKGQSGKTNREFCSVDPYIGRTDWAAYSGEWGLRRFLDGGASVFYRPDSNLKGGKTYLATQMVKVSEVENNPANFPKDGIMNIKALTEGATLNVEYYKTKQTLTTYKNWNNTANIINNPRLTFDRDWERIAAIITPNMDTVTRFVLTSYLSGFSCPIFTDDYFIGELVMGNISFYLDGEEVPETISTEDGAITKTVTYQVENQIGDTLGMSGKTTSSISLASAPSGVTFSGGVLTIPQNTKGTVVLSATAMPTDKWTACPQESFTKNISIILENDEEYVNPISSIKIGETEVSLTDEVFEYSVNVPVSYPAGVESFVLPQITAEATNTAHTVTVDVTEPVVETVKTTVKYTETEYKLGFIPTTVTKEKEIDGYTKGTGSAKATITVKDNGQVLETYVINMNLKGINLLVNGGFESDDNWHIGEIDSDGYFKTKTSNNEGDFVRNTGAAYSGSYGLSSTLSTGKKKYIPQPEIVGGKTYFASVMMRAQDSVTDDMLLNPPTGGTTFRFALNDSRGSSNPESAKITGQLYQDGARLSDSYYQNKPIFQALGFKKFDREWSNFTAVFKGDKNFNTSILLVDYGNENQSPSLYPIYTDDYFIGELVATGLDLTFNTSATEKTLVGDTVSTKNAIQTTLGVYGINQLGNNGGLIDKLTAEFELIEAPIGVLLEGDTLTIPSNTAGTVTVKAIATPNENWSDASQSGITDIISFELVPEIGFTLEYYEDYITSKLGYTNKTGAPLDVVIYYVTYIKDELSALVTEVFTEKTTLGIGETLSRERDIHLKENELFKCFLWKEGTLFPLVENAYTE